jgi:KDO2-lipid IV(A) lauroyltransferase
MASLAKEERTDDPRSRPTLAHRAQYAALRATVAVLSILPLRAASALGERLGMLGYRPLRIRRTVVERHVAAAFPELDRAAVQRVAREAYAHLGRTTIETALLPTLGRERILGLVEETPGWEEVDRAMTAGNGLILVSGHLGNWELGGAYLAARGVPIDVIARRMSNPRFDRYLTETRERIGMKVVYDDDAARRTPRALREGRAVAFLADQGVLGLASTFVPFFGRPAKTPRGPAVFALRMNVPLVFAAPIRQPNGRYHFVFERVDVARTGDREGDIDTIVAAYTATLERLIRRAPGQYLWHHRRWRRQPAGTPPELAEPR